MKIVLPVILIPTLVVGLILVIGCGASKEKQAVEDYIDSIVPVLNSYTSFTDQQNAFAQSRGLSRQQASAKLSDLTRQAEKIYLDVERSQPPAELREFKRKFSKVCQLQLQVLTLTVEAIGKNDISLVRQINTLTFEANTLHEEASQELLTVMKKYNIE